MRLKCLHGNLVGLHRVENGVLESFQAKSAIPNYSLDNTYTICDFLTVLSVTKESLLFSVITQSTLSFQWWTSKGVTVFWLFKKWSIQGLLNDSQRQYAIVNCVIDQFNNESKTHQSIIVTRGELKIVLLSHQIAIRNSIQGWAPRDYIQDL
jgi:hypothetical protein